MKLKTDGKNFLRFWLIGSETLYIFTFYRIARHLNLLGVLICATLLGIKVYEVLTDKQDVFIKFKKNFKVKGATMATMVMVLILMDIANGRNVLFYGLIFLAYYFVSSYTIHLYNWTIRWEDAHYSSDGKNGNTYAQLSHTVDYLEKINLKFIATRFFPLALTGGVLSYMIWISPIFKWVRTLLYGLFGKALLGLATVILGPLSKLSSGGTGSTDQPNEMEKLLTFIRETVKTRPPQDHSNVYAIVAAIIVGLMVFALGNLLLKKMRVQKAAKGGQTAGVQKPVWNQLFVEEKGFKIPNFAKKSAAPEELLRIKYLALMNQLKKQGYPIEKTDTADQLKSKLGQIYPNQEELIDIITEAYCVRRYADRDPENIHEVLEAFQKLKEATSYENG